MDTGYKKPRKRKRKPSPNPPGRPPGRLNTRTIEQQLIAEMDAARPGRALAKDRLEYAMNLFYGIMQATKPTITADGKMTIAKKPDSPAAKKLEEFYRAGKYMMEAANGLISFQSPRLSAMQIAPPRQETKRMSFTLNIFDNDGTKAETIVDGVRQIEGRAEEPTAIEQLISDEAGG